MRLPLLAFALIAATATPAIKLDSDGKVDCEFLRMHHAFVERARDPSIRLVFLGDSITHGWFWGDHMQLWDRHFAKYGAANFGIGGDRTEHLLWRIENGELDRVKPDVVVLLIGTNNIASPAEEITEGVRAVIRSVRDKLPQSRLLVMGIFPRGEAASDPRRAKIRAINAELAKLADGDRVHFLDIGSRFLGDDGTLPKDVMPDALHLSFKGYAIWAAEITPLIDRWMK